MRRPSHRAPADQHGKCEHCRLTAGLAAGDLDKLRHMLGATAHHPKTKWGFRNYYLCNVQDRESMERLVAAGLAVRGEVLLRTQYYHATRDVAAPLALTVPASLAR
jgi:hypothetical protein